MDRRVITNGDESDALDDKNAFAWRPGARRRIKARTNRRERRTAKAALRAGRDA